MPARFPRGTIAIASLCGVAAFAIPAALADPPYGAWSAPTTVEALPGSSTALNTPAIDGCVSLSRDGRSLFFNSNRAGSHDIYVATRPDTDSGFGDPELLPSTINTAADESCATFVQGNRLYFSRRSATDIADIYVSKLGPNGWGEAEKLGPEINTPGMEESVDFFEDPDGHTVMIFSRRNPDGSGGKIYQSIDGATAVLVPGGVNSAAADNRPSISKDGRTIYFDSTRPGGLGGPDLYYASRESTDQPFGPAINLRALNSPGFDARPSLSWDGSELFFSSNRPGSESVFPDMWRTARERARSGPKVLSF